MDNELLSLFVFLLGFVGVCSGLWFFYKLVKLVLLLVRYLELKISILQNLKE